MANDDENCILEPNFKFSRLIFFLGGGTPIPVQVCPSKPWSVYSTCKNLRAQYPLRAQIQSPEKCALRWVNIHINNFFICGPKFINFFRPTWDGLWLINYFFDFRYVDPFRRYSRSKSKVVRNLAGFWTFFSPSQILGGRPSKNWTHVITSASRCLDKNL